MHGTMFTFSVVDVKDVEITKINERKFNDSKKSMASLTLDSVYFWMGKAKMLIGQLPTLAHCLCCLQLVIIGLLNGVMLSRY